MYYSNRKKKKLLRDYILKGIYIYFIVNFILSLYKVQSYVVKNNHVCTRRYLKKKNNYEWYSTTMINEAVVGSDYWIAGICYVMG